MAAIACDVGNARGAAPGSTESATHFVRDVYDSYLSRSQAGGIDALDSLIVVQPSVFSDLLRAGLARDAARRRDAHGEIVGLDFDPLLASQDPCEVYETGKATRVDSIVRVEIYAVCQETRSTAPVVVVELMQYADRWKFTNLVYAPPVGDLLHILHSTQK